MLYKFIFECMYSINKKNIMPITGARKANLAQCIATKATQNAKAIKRIIFFSLKKLTSQAIEAIPTKRTEQCTELQDLVPLRPASLPSPISNLLDKPQIITFFLKLAYSFR